MRQMNMLMVGVAMVGLAGCAEGEFELADDGAWVSRTGAIVNGYSTAVTVEMNCTDLIDNDKDGRVDRNDTDCMGAVKGAQGADQFIGTDTNQDFWPWESMVSANGTVASAYIASDMMSVVWINAADAKRFEGGASVTPIAQASLPSALVTVNAGEWNGAAGTDVQLGFKDGTGFLLSDLGAAASSSFSKGSTSTSGGISVGSVSGGCTIYGC